MALPGDVTTFTLNFGPYTSATGLEALVAKGGKLFPVDPSTNERINVVHVATGQVIVPEPIAVTIAEDGTGSVGPIPHTDNAGLSPVGFAYRVEWKIPTGPRHASPGNLTFAVPTTAGATVDFDLLSEAESVPGVSVPVVYGHSAYDLAVSNGFVGTEDEWLASLVGPMGTTVPTGGAGGALSGEYPDPGLNEAAVENIVVASDAVRAAYAPVADPLRPRPMPPRAQPHWLALFEAGHGITPTGTFTAFTDHTADYLFGSQSVRLTIDPASSQAIIPFTLPAPVDITDQHFVLWIKSADIDRIGQFELRLGNATVTSFFRIPNWTLGTEKATHSGRWTPVAFSMARKASNIGTPSLTSVAAGELRVSSTPAGGLDMLIDSLGMVPHARAAFPQGVVTFVFDDAFVSMDTEARRIMDRYGYPGVTAAIADVTEEPGRTSLARLRVLRDLHGWEIGGHAPTAAEEAARLTSMTWEERESYLIRLKMWLRSEGFYSDFFVYPGGEQDAEIIEQVGRYFNTARDTSGQPRYNLPNYLDPLMLTQTGAGAGMLAAIAETPVHCHWSILYFHKVGTGGISVADFEAVVEACHTTGVEVLTVEQVLNRLRAGIPAPAFVGGGQL